MQLWIFIANQYQYQLVFFLRPFSEVGRFKTSVKMDCTTFKENMDLMDVLLEGRDKKEEVLMVCTGGIRCSVSGRYLKQRGFTDVKMVRNTITSTTT